MTDYIAAAGGESAEKKAVILMRKGQIKIIDRARRYGYSDACIEILSREDLTLRELENISYYLADCRKQTDSLWLAQYLRLAPKEDIGWLVRLYVARTENVSYDALKNWDTTEQLFDFFSTDKVICQSLFDVEFIIKYGYSEHTSSLLVIAHRLYDEFAETLDDDWRSQWDCWRKIDQIVERFPEFSDYKEIWASIRFIDWNNECYLENHIKSYFAAHSPFSLKNCKGIPKAIADTDFHGYRAQLQVHGTARFIECNSKRLSFSISPYQSVEVDQHGNFYVKVDSRKERTILFFHDTQEFVTAYRTANGNRFRATTLRDLYQSISISDGDEDNANADSVIDYLCNRYQTYIFRDLYADFLAWNCLLLPVTIAEAANYHNKNELFQTHFKMPITGDWNRKNANLSYLILKLHRRLTADGLARAMQCTNAPVQTFHIGRSRYKFAWMLYSAVYSVPIHALLEDSITEEYHAKRIHLNPENQTIHAHNERHLAVKQPKYIPKVKIKEDTKFQTLIDEMPDEFELIRTGKRICEEAAMQRNCVADYAKSISKDQCMIYSIFFENERHTIEIVCAGSKNRKYKVRQCYRSCNRAANPALSAKLTAEIRRINRIQH